MSDNQSLMESELKPPKADLSAPPPYEPATEQLYPSQQPSITTQTPEALAHLQQQSAGVPLHHGKLPTYEEVEMEKSLNGEMPPAFLPVHALQPAPPPPPPPPPNPLLGRNAGGGGRSLLPSLNANIRPAPAALTFIAIHATDAENLSNNSENLLGTDVMFMAAFLVAFLFNWIGFLMLTCFCQTIAARYGALSGFGLSLTKWSLIVKSTDLATHDNSWLWWLLMTFGFLICIRALIQYISIKRTWRLLSTTA